MTTMAHCAVRRAEREFATVKLSSGAIAELSGFIHNLVKGWEDVIRELNLGDRRASRGGVANRKPSNTLCHQEKQDDSKSSVRWASCGKRGHFAFLSLPARKAAS